MLDELYQEVILDHNNRPKHYGRLSAATHSAKGYNPICGDTVVLDIERNDDGTVKAVGFESNGCAISKAAASIMTDSVNQKTEEEIEGIIEKFLAMTTSEVDSYSLELDGDMAALSGVRMYPSRIKCANLPWHTLRAALKGEVIASTE